MLRKIWIELRSSLWFVPVVLVIAAVALALGLVQLDVTFSEALSDRSWQPLLNAGAEGARGMLTAIASSMITVAGVAFSITIVTLSLASTQYTPRILRNFMRDRANQFVLGIFVAIFTYCLIVLRTIRGGSEHNGGGFVPLLAVGFGMLLALLSIFCLIFFIHHVAASIQASSILQAISRETTVAIDALFPDKIGEGEESRPLAEVLSDAQWHPVSAPANGYIQHISPDGLLHFARERGMILRIECVPGDFAVRGAALASANRPLKEGDADSLRPFFVIGDFRTVEQDVGFGIRQIVDIALKALSPGVNDTSTAVSCLDYLCSILCELAPRRIASPFCGQEGELRVIAPVPDFADFVAKCFDEIRLCSASNVTIHRRILHVIGRVAAVARDSVQVQALLTHARIIRETADRHIAAPYDRERISAEIAIARRALGADTIALPPLPAINRAT